MIRNIVSATLALLLLLGASAQAQEDGIKVMLLYDMEGMSGATD